MNKLKLNFSSFEQRQHQQRQGFMLIVLAVLFGLVFNEYLTTQQHIAQAQNPQRSAVQHAQTMPLSAEMQREIESLRSVIAELNIPWAKLFSAIETVKKSNPDVLLTRFEPNLKKSELILSGEVKQLEDLLKFMDSLNQQAEFSHALLQSQQLLEEEGTMLFDLKLRWLRHE